MSLFLFWMLMLLCASEDSDVAIGLLVSMFVFCMAIGALITGERGIISQRAQRTLPKTFLGRVLLSWFYPGAGLGYVYLVAAFGAVGLTMASFEFFYAVYLNNLSGNAAIAATAYLLFCYVVIYVGINRLLMLALARFFPARMLGAFALMIVILLMAHLIPWMLAFYLNDYREFDFAWHQSFNIYLTIFEVNHRFSLDLGATFVIVTLCASAIFGLNLVQCTRDIMLVRVALPPRVREEQDANQETLEPVDPFAD